MRKSRFFALAFGVLLAVTLIAQPASAQTNENQTNEEYPKAGFFFGAGMSSTLFPSGPANVYSDFDIRRLNPVKIGAYYELPLGIGNFFAGLEGGYASGSDFGGKGGVSFLPVNANATFAFGIADLLYIGPVVKAGLLGVLDHAKYKMLPLLGIGLDLEFRYKYFPLSIYAQGGINAYPTAYNFSVLPTVEAGIRIPRGMFGRPRGQVPPEEMNTGTQSMTSASQTPQTPQTTQTATTPTVTGLTINPAFATVNQGATQQFTANVTGTNNPPQTVTWSVTGGTAGTSISPNGLLTIGPNQSAGNLTVTATSTADPSRSATANVTVPAPAGSTQLVPPGATPTASTVTNVTVIPSIITVPQGSTQQFNAQVTGTNNPPQTVTWAVTGGAAGTTISPTGLLTVGPNQPAANLTVTATSTADPSRSGTAAVTVPTPAPTAAPTVTNVTVTPGIITVPQGSTQQFNAQVTGTNSPPQTVTWAVTGGEAGTTISPTGLLTVGPNQTPGTLTVRATSTADTSRSGTATVTVPAPSAGSTQIVPPGVTSPTAPTVTTIIVNPVTSIVPQGFEQHFTAIVEGTNNPPQTVTWSVIGGGAGTSIDQNGLLIVGPNQTPGNLTVRATSTADPSRSGTSAVTVPAPVVAPTVTNITVIPSIITVPQGSTQQFSAQVTGTNNPPQTVTWAVTGGTAGTTISPTGLLTVGPNQTPGTLTVRATSTADTSRSATSTVTVPAPAAAVTTPPVTPPTVQVIPPPASTLVPQRRDIMDTSKQSLFAEVHFEPDTAVLIESTRPQLDSAGRYLQANPNLWVIVRTYTAPFGTAEGRFLVALDRARFCRDYFIRNYGISPERIVTETLASERLPENVVIEEWITYRTAELIMLAE